MIYLCNWGHLKLWLIPLHYIALHWVCSWPSMARFALYLHNVCFDSILFVTFPLHENRWHAGLVCCSMWFRYGGDNDGYVWCMNEIVSFKHRYVCFACGISVCILNRYIQPHTILNMLHNAPDVFIQTLDISYVYVSLYKSTVIIPVSQPSLSIIVQVHNTQKEGC
jgi:hypothetical protein